jgi:hypothetical protein
VSEVSEVATVSLLLADYAVASPDGKINALGAGLTALALNPMTGLTAGFALIVRVGVPPQLYEAECSVEILLEDSSGGLVEVSLAPGVPPQPIRVGQAVTFERPRFPTPVAVPSAYLPARAQWVLHFANGLPLVAGQGYGWRVRIDSAGTNDWAERFVVVGAPAGPVLG